MTDPATDTRTLLQTLARSDPGFTAFAEDHAALARERLAPDTAGQLAAAALAALREDPAEAERVQRLTEAPAASLAPARFDAAAVPLLLAVVFLLRTHLRIRRHKDGSWDLLVEHRPGGQQAGDGPAETHLRPVARLGCRGRLTGRGRPAEAGAPGQEITGDPERLAGKRPSGRNAGQSFLSFSGKRYPGAPRHPNGQEAGAFRGRHVPVLS